MVKGELQLGFDGPCGDNEQERGLAPMHHAVVNDKWKLGAEGPEESGLWSIHMVRIQSKSTWSVRL
jgi:hypothetical protein